MRNEWCNHHNRDVTLEDCVRCRLFGTVAERSDCDAGKRKITSKAASSILKRVGLLSVLWAAMCRWDQAVVE